MELNIIITIRTHETHLSYFDLANGNTNLAGVLNSADKTHTYVGANIIMKFSSKTTLPPQA